MDIDAMTDRFIDTLAAEYGRNIAAPPRFWWVGA